MMPPFDAPRGIFHRVNFNDIHYIESEQRLLPPRRRPPGGIARRGLRDPRGDGGAVCETHAARGRVAMPSNEKRTDTVDNPLDGFVVKLGDPLWNEHQTISALLADEFTKRQVPAVRLP